MTIIILSVAVLLVFGIAAGVVGREAHRLDAQAPRVVFELEEAVGFVADRLPYEVAAVLTHDDVRQLLRWHVNVLRAEGMRPVGNADVFQDPDELVVVDEEASVDALVERSTVEGVDYRPEDLAAVVAAHFDYLREIGAVGPPAGDADL